MRGEEGVEPPAAKSAKVAAPPSEEPSAAAVVTEVVMMDFVNHFEALDPTHYRKATCCLKIVHKKAAIYCELEVHFHEILAVLLTH